MTHPRVDTGALPLLSARDLAAPLAWCSGTPVSAAQFLAEAGDLATRLPASGQAVNLCSDRYRFALGFAAALLRGQASLMPPNALPATLRQLHGAGHGLYALVDSGDTHNAGHDAPHDTPHALPSVPVTRGHGLRAPPTVPLLPAAADAVCLLTSGSTGAPQPHRKRWGSLVANIGAEAERLAELMDWPSLAGLNIVATVPAQHSYGFESSVLLALLGGAAFDSGRPFYPADIAAALQRLPRPRALVSTPFHLKALLRAGLALPAVDLVLSATAPLSPQLALQAEQALGARLVEIYGCTEAGQVAARRTTAGETWTTLGALRLWREADAQGERFVVAGGHVVEPTPLADVLELQDARRFRLLGRSNDLIHVAGKRSSLSHLNFHLNRIDGVDDGAFWLPDEVTDGVVRPVAFVVAPRLGADQVIQALRQQLEPAFVPRRVVHVPALPRDATGKLGADRLRGLALQLLGAPVPATTLPTSPAGPAPVAAVDAATGAVDIGADHPAFDGHFPGAPVLPGVVLLGLVLQTVARQPALQQRLGATPQIEQVKFVRAVGPGARLRVAAAEHGSGVAFEVFDGSHCVARGQLGSAAPAR